MRNVLSPVAIATVALAASIGLTGATGTAAAPATLPQNVAASEANAAAAQDRFSELGYAALQRFPHEVVDFVWLGDRGQIVVMPSAVEVIARTFEDPAVEIVAARDATVAYLDRTNVELEAMRLFESVPALGSGARYVPENNSVELKLWSDTPAETTHAANAVVGNAKRSLGGVNVSIVVTDGDLPVEAVEGGEVYGSCTGGFIGYRGAPYGVITAAHCTSKPSTYDGATTGSTYVASNNYDVRFTALSGGTPVNSVRAGSTSYSWITSIGIVSAGMNIAKYGRITGYGSTSVSSYVGCLSFSSGNTWCGLYRTTAQIVDHGDSGGPWFYINKAYGTTTGFDSGSLITPIAMIGYISGGVTVKTS